MVQPCDPSEVSDVVDREAEILALEEKTIDALKEAEDGGDVAQVVPWKRLLEIHGLKHV